MSTIEQETIINAPVERCFQLSLSIDLALEAARPYGLTAVDGVTTGQIGPHQRVSWQTQQFGIRVRHTSEITRYDPPFHFRDEMVRGLFRTFRHDHWFRFESGRTVMRDSLEFSLPFWLLSAVSERLIVRGRLRELLRRRNQLIQQRAEQQ